MRLPSPDALKNFNCSFDEFMLPLKKQTQKNVLKRGNL